MRILVLGAGAVGGYFGARLLEAGGDVTFLLRPARLAAIRDKGLVVKSPQGDLTLKPPATDRAGPGYDLVMLACKAYDLASAMDAIAPAMTGGAAVLPLLNGLAHLDALTARFGAAAVLGGTVHIGATLGPAGEIVHSNRVHDFFFGELDRARSARCRDLDAVARRAKLQATWSADIVQEMWEKLAFLCPLAAGTSLMRGTVAQICATPEGEATMLALLDECVAIARAEGRRIDAASLRGTVADKRSSFSSSMFRDIEKGNEIEAKHIVGDMLARARKHAVATPTLAAAWAHLCVYRLRRSERAR